MSLFVVEASKCKKDHICVAVCPLGLIEGADGVPKPTKNAEELCVSCGHCVAACPTGALSHRAMKPEECTPIKPELKLTAEQAEQFLLGRRSIRAYRSDPVDQAALARIVATASAGPSGHNTQPVEWLIIHNTSEVKRLTGLVIDWMRFMIKQKPEFAKGLLLEHVVDKWEQGIDAVCRSAPHVVLYARAQGQHDGLVRLHDRSGPSGAGCAGKRTRRVLGRLLRCRSALLASASERAGSAGGSYELWRYDGRASKVQVPSHSDQETGENKLEVAGTISAEYAYSKQAVFIRGEKIT